MRAGSDAWDVAERVLLLLQPDLLCEDTTSKTVGGSLDADDFPVLETLSPVVQSVWPWTHFGTLRSARQQGLWTCAALDICSQAVKASASMPVTVVADPAAHRALHQALTWLVQGGFVFDGVSSWRSFPVSP